MLFDLASLVGTRVPRLSAPFFPDLMWRVAAAGRSAFLTFDDGPTPGVTGRLLDVLARFEARAVFFLVGAHAERDPGLVRAIADAGHGVGNHTYTHPDAWRVSAGRLTDELDRTTALLEDLIQAPVPWMRPPYGRFTRPMRAWCLARRQRLTMWDVMPGDYIPGTTAARVERRVLRLLRPGSIVVLHDNPRTRAVTPAALDALLERLSSDGWRFPRLQASAA